MLSEQRLKVLDLVFRQAIALQVVSSLNRDPNHPMHFHRFQLSCLCKKHHQDLQPRLRKQLYYSFKAQRNGLYQFEIRKKVKELKKHYAIPLLHSLQNNNRRKNRHHHPSRRDLLVLIEIEIVSIHLINIFALLLNFD